MFRNWSNDWNIALPYNELKKLNEKEYYIEIETSFEKTYDFIRIYSKRKKERYN